LNDVLHVIAFIYSFHSSLKQYWVYKKRRSSPFTSNGLILVLRHTCRPTCSK